MIIRTIERKPLRTVKYVCDCKRVSRFNKYNRTRTTKGNILNSKVRAFAVYIDEEALDSGEARRLLQYAVNEQASVAGYDSTCRTKRDVSNVNVGDYITVGLARRYDIDYVKGYNAYRELKGVKIYDLIDDYDDVYDALDKFIKERNKRDKTKRPLFRTNREMLLSDLDKEGKLSVNKRKSSYRSKTRSIYVQRMPHYLQFEDEIIPCDPNDIFCI